MKFKNLVMKSELTFLDLLSADKITYFDDYIVITKFDHKVEDNNKIVPHNFSYPCTDKNWATFRKFIYSGNNWKKLNNISYIIYKD